MDISATIELQNGPFFTAKFKILPRVGEKIKLFSKKDALDGFDGHYTFKIEDICHVVHSEDNLLDQTFHEVKIKVKNVNFSYKGAV